MRRSMELVTATARDGSLQGGTLALIFRAAGSNAHAPLGDSAVRVFPEQRFASLGNACVATSRFTRVSSRFASVNHGSSVSDRLISR